MYLSAIFFLCMSVLVTLKKFPQASRFYCLSVFSPNAKISDICWFFGGDSKSSKIDSELSYHHHHNDHQACYVVSDQMYAGWLAGVLKTGSTTLGMY